MESVIVRKFENDDMTQVKGPLFEEAMFRMPPLIGAEVPESYLQTFEEDILLAVKSGLSLVAEESKSGKIVGFLVNKEVDAEQFLNETVGLDSEYKPIAVITEILNHIRKEGKLLEKYPNVKKLMHLDFMFVKEEFGGRGIATQFMKRSVDVAAQHGLGCVFAEASSHYTYKIAMKCGYEELFRLKLDNWKTADGTPASQIFDLKRQGIHRDYSFCCKVIDQ